MAERYTSFIERLLASPNEATARRLLGAQGVISNTDSLVEGSTNLYFTNERVDDRVAALIVAGTDITVTYNDVTNTLTIAYTGSGGGAVPTGSGFRRIIGGVEQATASFPTAAEVGADATGSAAAAQTAAATDATTKANNAQAFAIQRANHTGTQAASTLSGTLQAAQFPALTGDVTTTAGSLAASLATNQPAVHTWALAQTFTVAPIFSDQAGTRTALGLGTLATQNGTFSGSSSGTNTGDQTLAGLGGQPLDATLTALAANNWAANALPIGSGADTMAQVAFAANTFPARASTGNLVAKVITDFGLSLVDDIDAAAARTTLGLGSAATTASTAYATAAQGTLASSAVQPAGLAPYAQLAGANFTGIVNVATGTSGVQEIVRGFGWSTGAIRWKEVMETDGSMSYYGYTSVGLTPLLGVNIKCTSAGGANITTFPGSIKLTPDVAPGVVADGMIWYEAGVGFKKREGGVTSAIGAAGAAGTVTNVTATNSNGVTFTISTPSTTPNIAIAVATAADGTNNTDVATTAYAMKAAPNASYRTLLDSSGSHTAARVAGTYALGQDQVAQITGQATLQPLNIIYIDPADYPTVNGLAPKLRVRATLFVNAVAPTGNFTFGLHPVTRPAAASSGAAGLLISTIGAAVAGSTGTISAPAAGSMNQVASADFAMPAAGYYVIGMVSTAAVAASSHLHLSACLQLRNN